MHLKMFPAARTFASVIAIVLLSLGTGCSTSRQAANEPRVRWFAHCETCQWCKGAFKSSDVAQQTVTNHNKEFHDWFKVAYYDQVRCP